MEETSPENNFEIDPDDLKSAMEMSIHDSNTTDGDASLNDEESEPISSLADMLPESLEDALERPSSGDPKSQEDEIVSVTKHQLSLIMNILDALHQSVSELEKQQRQHDSQIKSITTNMNSMDAMISIILDYFDKKIKD